LILLVNFSLWIVANGDDDACLDICRDETRRRYELKNGRTLYPDSATIELSVEANPGRRGTKAHKFFEIARMCRDIRAYREAGGSLPYLRWFKGRGKLEIVV
jgi:hypothetical protein